MEPPISPTDRKMSDAPIPTQMYQLLHGMFESAFFARDLYRTRYRTRCRLNAYVPVDSCRLFPCYLESHLHAASPYCLLVAMNSYRVVCQTLKPGSLTEDLMLISAKQRRKKGSEVVKYYVGINCCSVFPGYSMAGMIVPPEIELFLVANASVVQYFHWTHSASITGGHS